MHTITGFLKKVFISSLLLIGGFHAGTVLAAYTPGYIYTVAGNGTSGYSGDNGPATSATLNLPSGIAVDGAGNLYIADTLNNQIRMVTATTGIITTYPGASNRPLAVAVDIRLLARPTSTEPV